MSTFCRAVVAASSLLPGVLSAQEFGSSAIDAAMSAAERYFDCMSRNDRDCLEAMHDPVIHEPLVERDEQLRESALDDGRVMPTSVGFSAWRGPAEYEVARPWEPFVGGGRLFAFVPYFSSIATSASGDRREGAYFAVGVSDDAGETWRFAYAMDLFLLDASAIDRLIPGYSAQPKPGSVSVSFRDPPLERTRWLQTTERSIVVVGEAHAYAVKFEIRREIDEPVALTVQYDNPADPSRPGYFRSTLQPGQQTLEWQSTPITGLVQGQTYEVVIEARDPGTDALLFEHRQALMYQQTREIWRSVLSKPPAAQP